MNILYFGELNELGVKICNSLSLTDNVLAAAPRKSAFQLDCQCVVGDQNAAALAMRHQADVLIYAEHAAEDMNRVNETITQVLQTASCRLIYIKEKSIFSRRQVKTAIAALLCEAYAARYKVPVTLMEPSCLYGEELQPAYFTQAMAQIRAVNEFTPDGAEDEFCDCLHVDDFCGALKMVVEHQEPGWHRMPLQSGYPFPLKCLVTAINREYKQITVNPYRSEAPEEENVSAAPPEGWTPQHGFLEDLDTLFAQTGEKDKKLSLIKRNKAVRGVIIALVFLMVFVLSELYIQFITVSSDLQFVDMRLLFVVLSSLTLGKKYGVGAAVLCSVASIAQGLLNGYNWYVLFYHVDNWIPIAVYFAVAVGIGMYREKMLQHREQIDP